jgi:hypothetical protein
MKALNLTDDILRRYETGWYKVKSNYEGAWFEKQPEHWLF